MNLEAQKTDVVQDFISEEKHSRQERTLKKEGEFFGKRRLEPMAQVKLNKRVDQSESDFQNNRFKSSSELLAKYE